MKIIASAASLILAAMLPLSAAADLPSIGVVAKLLKSEDQVDQAIAKSYINGSVHSAYSALAFELAEVSGQDPAEAWNTLVAACGETPEAVWQVVGKLIGTRELLFTNPASPAITLVIRTYCHEQMGSKES